VHLLDFRGGDCQSRGEQAVRQKAADAMDPARRTSSLADPHRTLDGTLRSTFERWDPGLANEKT